MVASGDLPLVSTRHTAHLCDLLVAAEMRWETMGKPEWVSAYGPVIDDVRAALEWAFGPDGNLALGVRLTALSLPLGFQLCLIDEFRIRVERALQNVGHVLPAPFLEEMRLNVAMAALGQNTAGPSPKRLTRFATAIRLARRLGPMRYRVEPLIGMAAFELGLGQYKAATSIARHVQTIAGRANDPGAMVAANRVMAQASHFAGDHVTGDRLARELLRPPIRSVPLAYSQAPVDLQVSMRIVESRAAWMMGFPDRSERIAGEAVQLAGSDSPFSLCQALVLAACPIAFWRGDNAGAARLTALLLQQATRYTLGHWHEWGRFFEAALQASESPEGDYATEFSPRFSGPLQTDTFATFGKAKATPEAGLRATNGMSGWATAEILRRRAERSMPEGDAGAEAMLLRSLDVARQQHALSWELRTVTTLARLRLSQERRGDGVELLAPVLERFTEGFGTQDLLAGNALLLDLHAHQLV